MYVIMKRHLIGQNFFVGANTEILYVRYCIIIIKTNPGKKILPDCIRSMQIHFRASF